MEAAAYVGGAVPVRKTFGFSASYMYPKGGRKKRLNKRKKKMKGTV